VIGEASYGSADWLPVGSAVRDRYVDSRGEGSALIILPDADLVDVSEVSLAGREFVAVEHRDDFLCEHRLGRIADDIEAFAQQVVSRSGRDSGGKRGWVGVKDRCVAADIVGHLTWFDRCALERHRIYASAAQRDHRPELASVRGVDRGDAESRRRHT